MGALTAERPEIVALLREIRGAPGGGGAAGAPGGDAVTIGQVGSATDKRARSPGSPDTDAERAEADSCASARARVRQASKTRPIWHARG
jgi:hypothetical protein